MYQAIALISASVFGHLLASDIVITRRYLLPASLHFDGH